MMNVKLYNWIMKTWSPTNKINPRFSYEEYLSHIVDYAMEDSIDLTLFNKAMTDLGFEIETKNGRHFYNLSTQEIRAAFNIRKEVSND